MMMLQHEQYNENSVWAKEKKNTKATPRRAPIDQPWLAHGPLGEGSLTPTQPPIAHAHVVVVRMPLMEGGHARRREETLVAVAHDGGRLLRVLVQHECIHGHLGDDREAGQRHRNLRGENSRIQRLPASMVISATTGKPGNGTESTWREFTHTQHAQCLRFAIEDLHRKLVKFLQFVAFSLLF